MENRDLQKFPKWKTEDAMDGDWFTKLDTYFTDQLFGRDLLYRSYAFAHKMAGLRRIGNVVFGPEEELLAYYKYAPDTEEALANKAERIEMNYRIIEKLDALMKEYGGQLIFVQMPAKRIIHVDDYPVFYRNYKDTSPREFEIFQQAMAERGIPCIDLREPFFASGESCYFQTDHHINAVGASITYDQLIEAMREYDTRVEKYNFTWETLDQPMLGSYNRQIGGIIWPNRDQIRVATPEGGYISYQRTDDRDTSRERENRPLVNTEEKNEYGLYYNAYMGGDMGLTEITTGRPELPRLLMSGDSYTNIVEPLLFQSFDATTYVDTRFDRTGGQFSLETYIREFQPDFYIMMYTAPLANLYIKEDLTARLPE